MILSKSFTESIDKALPLSIMALAFAIPVSYRLTIYLLFACAVLWFVSFKWVGSLKKVDPTKPHLFLMGFWFLYAISLFYSDNSARGISDVTQKISLLIIPLIFATGWERIRGFRADIINTFLIGLSFIGLYLIIRAFFQSVIVAPYGLIFHPRPILCPWENYFYYFRFTQPIHPAYLSMYYSLGLVLIASKFKGILTFTTRLVSSMLFLFFLLMIYLSSSKAGLITGIITLQLCLFWVLKIRLRLIAGIAMAILIGLSATLLISNSRVSNFILTISSYRTDETHHNVNNADDKFLIEGAVRLQIWESIPDAIGKNWLMGVGVGDAKQALLKSYNANEVEYASDMQLNAHNQFLETYLALGVVGLALLVTILFLGFKMAVQNRNMILFLFLSIMSINFLFESVLERIFGVVFFTFFYTMLYDKK